MVDTKAEEAKKYRVFLKRSWRRVKRPATDHDRTQIGEGQNAIKDRIDLLTDLKSQITKAIRTRIERLESEERELRTLFRDKQKEEFVEVAVYVDARQGGTIVVVDIATDKLVGEPRPLTAPEREVFASTKAQPELFGGDTVAVNEELAKKLNLLEYLAEDKPTTIEQRVARALEKGDLPEDLKDAISDLAEDDDNNSPAPSPSKKKADSASPPPEKKKRGRPKKETAPTPVEPSKAPTEPKSDADDHPGPDKPEKDVELPKRPPAPVRAVETDEDEPSAGDVAEAEAMADPPEKTTEEAAEEAAEESPAVEEDDGEDIPEFENPGDEEEPSEGPEPTEEPPADAPIETDPVPEADDAEEAPPQPTEDAEEEQEEPAPASGTYETEPAETVTEEPTPEPVAPAPAVSEPVQDEPSAVPVTVPEPKGDVLSVANHFGFADEKRAEQAINAIVISLSNAVVFSDNLVDNIAKASKAAIRPGTVLAKAIPAIIEHLVAEKKIRQRKLKKKVDGKPVYAYFCIPTRKLKNSLTDEAVDAAIAEHEK